MSLIIRTEQPKDHKTVFSIIEQAFENAEFTDHKEQFLVERLRKSNAFVPDLSLVAELYKNLVGHILFTRIKIVGNTTTESLALAPVSVLPKYQGHGIGAELIQAGHQKAREMGFGSVILLGHAHYYPRFGYQPASKFDITLPFEAPDENCMAIELAPSALKNAAGAVQYPNAFLE